MSTSRLEETFKSFVKTVEGAECVEAVAPIPRPKGLQIADYFFENRQVICELKVLRNDMEWKINNILEPYRDTPEFPTIFGAIDLQRVLSCLPEGKQLNEKIIRAVTSSVEHNFADANRQIRDTKTMFSLPSAGGLVVILNDLVGILSPRIIMHRLGKLLRKKTPENEVRFSDVTGIWLINETHYVELNAGWKGIPNVYIANDYVSNHGVANEVINMLQLRWAAYNRVPDIELDFDSFKRLRFKRSN